ncbi:MAG: phospholipase D family protein [Eubacteriales bacterium]
MRQSMFDTANNRLDYGDLLQPDIDHPGEDWKLEFAVGFTYSLDLEALLGVPISLGLMDEMDTSLRDNPYYVLEAIRKSSDKIAIFCNAGGISLPQSIRSIYTLLENSVFEVKLPNKQNFHPKMWFIKYNSHEKSYIKLIVLSRNLTFDSSLDYSFEMTGVVGRAKRLKNQPLSDMLMFASEFSNKAKKEKILSLAKDVLNVKQFEIESPFEEYTFLPLGIPAYDKSNTGLFEGNRDVIVVSPFLSDDIVKEITKVNGRKTLITRKVSLNKCALEAFNQSYITKEVLVDNELASKHDIHAKLYFTSGTAGNHLYIGSANASHNAFFNNVEFLIMLKYAPRQASYDQILNDLIPKDNCPFEEITTTSEILPAEKDKALDDALKEAVWGIRGARVIEEGDRYDIELRTINIASKILVRIAPLQKSYALVPLGKITLLQQLLLKELSQFYILEAEGKKIVVKIETSKIPLARDEAIYKGIISTKSDFMSYLSMLLSENYVQTALEQEEEVRIIMAGMGDQIVDRPVSGIYEKLLKVMVQDPDKLKAIADVMKKIDPEVIGDDFRNMYKYFELATRRLRK